MLLTFKTAPTSTEVLAAMSISQSIVPHLPYLRRFARALCGSQRGGDAYVEAVLATLIADPSGFPYDLETRVALYRQLLRVWNSVAVNTIHRPESANAAEAAAIRSLDAVTPKPRQAFLLMSVEMFTAEQTARILDTDVQDVTRLVTQAGREIAEQVSTNVLIIEDEPLIAMDLAELAESLGHRVIGRARTHSEAVRAVKRMRPGLVLADIKLADGSSGLDAVNEILQSMNVPIIFITAYPERLLTGERPEPTFLIPKPFETDTVKAIISQALFFDTRPLARGGAMATS
jgi:CheY-like chemotaxis protein/DNA-directed RNA polymerase specialized sigma24 family protein